MIHKCRSLAGRYPNAALFVGGFLLMALPGVIGLILLSWGWLTTNSGWRIPLSVDTLLVWLMRAYNRWYVQAIGWTVFAIGWTLMFAAIVRANRHSKTKALPARVRE